MGSQCQGCEPCKEPEQNHEFYSEAFQPQVVVKEQAYEGSHKSEQTSNCALKIFLEL